MNKKQLKQRDEIKRWIVGMLSEIGIELKEFKFLSDSSGVMHDPYIMFYSKTGIDNLIVELKPDKNNIRWVRDLSHFTLSGTTLEKAWDKFAEKWNMVGSFRVTEKKMTSYGVERVTEHRIMAPELPCVKSLEELAMVMTVNGKNII